MYMASNNSGQPTTPTRRPQPTTMEVNIGTPISANNSKIIEVDALQGPGDPYKAALGHEDLGVKIRKWAIQVLEIGSWPKPDARWLPH